MGSSIESRAAIGKGCSLNPPRVELEVKVVSYRKGTLWAYLSLIFAVLSGVALYYSDNPSEFSKWLFVFNMIASGILCTRSKPLRVITTHKVDLTPAIEHAEKLAAAADQIQQGEERK